MVDDPLYVVTDYVATDYFTGAAPTVFSAVTDGTTVWA
jgi:hypothetical protein